MTRPKEAVTDKPFEFSMPTISFTDEQSIWRARLYVLYNASDLIISPPKDTEIDIKELVTEVASIVLVSSNWHRFNTIQLLVEITEKGLGEICQLLEQYNFPLALLTCGLLLDNQISTHIEEKDNPDAYWEKRTHDAITFYMKAAKDKEIRPVVDFLLWNMKEISKHGSVQTRLSQLNLIPPNFNNQRSENILSKQAGNSYGLFSRVSSNPSVLDTQNDSLPARLTFSQWCLNKAKPGINSDTPTQVTHLR